MCVCVFGVCSAEDMEDVIQTSSWAAVVAVPQIYQNPKIHCFIMMFPIKMAVWWYTPFQSHQNTHIWLVIYSPYIYPYKYIIYISLYTHSINHHFIMFFHLNPHVTVLIMILACFSCLILAESSAPERQVYATKDPRRSRSHLRRMARNSGHDVMGPGNVWCFIWDSFTLSKSKVATAGKYPVWLTTINGYKWEITS